MNVVMRDHGDQVAILFVILVIIGQFIIVNFVLAVILEKSGENIESEVKTIKLLKAVGRFQALLIV